MRVHQFAHEAMSTVFGIAVAGKRADYAAQAAGAAFAEIDRLESLFSRFEPTSEISRLNRLAPGGSMRVGCETADILGLGLTMEQATGGAFSLNRPAGWLEPVRAGARRRLNEGRAAGTRTPAIAARPALNSLIKVSAHPGYFEVVRRKRGRTGASGLDIDLGAIGKGYALDAAAEVLAAWGVDNVLLHSGTSTALGLGRGPGKTSDPPGWPVSMTVGEPDGSGRGGTITMRLDGLALSGSGPEVKGDHIYDPRTGRAARGKLLAWASHRRAAVSDAAATAFFVMDRAAVATFCREHPETGATVIAAGKKCRIFRIGME